LGARLPDGGLLESFDERRHFPLELEQRFPRDNGSSVDTAPNREALPTGVVSSASFPAGYW